MDKALRSEGIRAMVAVIFVIASFIAAPVHGQTSDPPASPKPAADEVMPTFKSLISDLPHDVRRLPTIANGVWLGGAAGLALAIHPSDRSVAEEATESSGVEFFLDSGALMGNGVIQGGGALATYLIGRAAHRPDIGVLGADLVRAQIVNTALTQGVKIAADRRRPDGGRFSFPSGHTSSSFATATVLQQHFGWKVGLPAYALATYVGGSRLSENKHFLSDVIVGAGIGLVSGRAVTVGSGSRRFSVAPVLAPGTVGFSLTKVQSQHTP